MLNIEIEGKPVFINPDTVIQLEMNSSIFNTEKIEGDIVFTFNIPVIENEKLFNFAQYVYIENMRRYSCEVKAGGIAIADGNLYLQKTSTQTYECGLILNPLPDGYAEKAMSANDFGDDVVISTHFHTHRAQWVEFLKSTLSEESIIKFFLQRNNDYYSDNEDFGFNADGSGAGAPDRTKLVNRLLYDNNGNLREIWLWNKLHCDPSNFKYSELYQYINLNPNGFSFAPAVHFLWIMEKIVQAAGYRIVGNFTKAEWVKKLFYQSLYSFDKQITDYFNTNYKAMIWGKNQVENYNPPNNTGIFEIYGINNINAGITFDNNTHQFTISKQGLYEFHLSGTFVHNHTGIFIDNTVAFVVVRGNNPPDFVNHTNIVDMVFFFDTDPIPQDYIGFAIISSAIVSNAMISEASFRWRFNLVPETYRIYFMQEEKDEYGYGNGNYKAIQFNGNGMICNRTLMTEDTNDFFYQGGYDDLLYSFISNKTWNIFTDRFNYKDLMPNLTNGEFLTNICNMFGLTFFIDSKEKMIEFSFIEGLLQQRNAINLSEFFIDRSETVTVNAKTNYEYTLPSVAGDNPIEAENYMGEFNTFAELDFASVLLDKIAFVISENQYYKVMQTQNNAVEWQLYSGNTGKLSAFHYGAKNTTKIEPKVEIPAMVSTPERPETDLYPQLSKQAYSIPFNGSENPDLSLILLYYKGKGNYRGTLTRPRYGTVIEDWNFEQASPLFSTNNENGTNGLDLTAIGKDSIGENLIKEWIELLASHNTVTCQFLLPIHKFIEVARLLKPQTDGKNIRWIHVNGVDLLPKKMVFEFHAGKEWVTAQIECAKPAEIQLARTKVHRVVSPTVSLGKLLKDMSDIKTSTRDDFKKVNAVIAAEVQERKKAVSDLKTMIVKNQGNQAIQVKPIGEVDGKNRTFSIPDDHIVDATEEVIVNGQVLTRNIDYTISKNVIELKKYIPDGDGVIRVNYVRAIDDDDENGDENDTGSGSGSEEIVTQADIT